jgi:hypothetical protein
VENHENVRAARLLEAQRAAEELFRAIGAEGILRPGVLDSEASRAVTELAADRFGVESHWHKRIVRSGPNTLQPYTVDPPDREMTDDDIVFADFGPVFDGWEADFGRTWVLGDDPAKVRLRNDLAPVFAAGKAFFEARPAVTAAVAIWWASSRTRTWRVGASTRSSAPAMTGCCEARTPRAGLPTGFWRCTWSTGTDRSAGSSRSCSRWERDTAAPGSRTLSTAVRVAQVGMPGCLQSRVRKA